MKNLMRKLLPIVLVLTLAAGIVLFIDPEETRAAENKVGSLNFLELNLAPKAKETLVLTGAKAKSYKSSKKSVATVSKKGVITAKKEGTAKITVTDTKGKKYTCKVTVKKNSLTIAKTGIKADNVYTEGKYASIDSRVSSGNEESVSVYLVKPDGTVFLSENMYEPTSDGLISQYAVVNTDNFIGYKVMDNGLILCIERGYYKSNGKKAFNLNFQKGATIFKTSEFDSGVAVVRLGETFDSDIWDYLINEKGKVLAKANIDIEYNKKGEFFRNPSEGMTAYLSEKYDPDNDIWEYELLGYYDAKGKLIKVKTPEGKNYNYGYNFSDGLAAVETNGKIGFIDKKGKLVIPCEYTDFWMFDGKLFYNGMGIVAKGSGDDKKYGVIDKNNKTIIPFEYDYIYSVDKNYFVVGKYNKY